METLRRGRWVRYDGGNGYPTPVYTIPRVGIEELFEKLTGDSRCPMMSGKK
jgi:hypothetical protein